MSVLLFRLLLKCYQNVNQCLYSLLSQVNPGSLAAKCGLQTGDIILKIGNADTSSLRHKEAQNSIIAAGNRLDLLLQRYLSLTYMLLNFPAHGYITFYYSTWSVRRQYCWVAIYDAHNSTYIMYYKCMSTPDGTQFLRMTHICIYIYIYTRGFY